MKRLAAAGGCPAFIPLVAATGLSAVAKAAMGGLLVFGIPQVLMVGAVAALGKPGFAYLKHRMKVFFKTHGSPQRVSRTRYRTGPYVSGLIPVVESRRVALGIIGDLMFLASFFVLGGNFWDKVRTLFDCEAKAGCPIEDHDQNQPRQV